MSRQGRSAGGKRRAYALVFAALGDETRLLLVAKLTDGQVYSISQLTEGFKMTRQAITKHLRVLEDVGIVHGFRAGRENLFELNPRPIKELKKYLEAVSEEWDRRLGGLKAFVEE